MAINGISNQPASPSGSNQPPQLPVATEPVATDSPPRTASQEPLASAARSAPAAVSSTAPAPSTPVLQQVDPAGREALENLVERISELIRIERRSLAFDVYEDINRTVVTVTDTESSEVIRQIPSEEIVRLAKAIREINEQRTGNGNQPNLTGLLISDQA